MNYKFLFKILFTLGLTFALFYACLQKMDLRLLISALRGVRLELLLTAALGACSILVLNSIQLKCFLPSFKQVTFKKMFQLVSIFSMTVNVVPFWGGHAILIYLLGQKEKVGKAVALSVLTLDQVIEGFSRIFLFGVVVFTASFPVWMRPGMQWTLLVIGLAYLVLFSLAFYFRGKRKVPEACQGTLRGSLYAVFVTWAHHLHVLRSTKKLLLTAGMAILMKFIEVLAVFLVQKSLGLSLGLSEAFLVVAALSLATTLPLTPGRLGVFESAAFLTYQYLGIEVPKAFVLGVLIHAVHTLPFVVAGYLAAIQMSLTGIWKDVYSKQSIILE